MGLQAAYVSICALRGLGIFRWYSPDWVSERSRLRPKRVKGVHGGDCDVDVGSGWIGGLFQGCQRTLEVVCATISPKGFGGDYANARGSISQCGAKAGLAGIQL